MNEKTNILNFKNEKKNFDKFRDQKIVFYHLFNYYCLQNESQGLYRYICHPIWLLRGVHI